MSKKNLKKRERWVNELEDRPVEITQAEKQRGKKSLNKSFTDKVYHIKQSDM